MKKIIVATTFLSVALLFSCNTSTSGDPKVVLSQFIDAMSKQDFSTARNLATAGSQPLLNMMETGFKMAGDKMKSEFSKYDGSKIEYGEAKIVGDKATVAVIDKTSGKSSDVPLKKENGVWKVDLDISSMMGNMNKELMDKGINPMDSLQKGMDMLKDINTDSLKLEMEHGMKALDSMKEALKKIQ